MSAFSDEQDAALRDMLGSIVTQTNKALESLAIQTNRAQATQQLLALETAELLIARMQNEGTEHLAVLALLMDKGVITSAELEAKREEMAAQWQVESALDPYLAGLIAVMEKLRREVEQLTATLKKQPPEDAS
jgi:hypothetical protein